jgi:hypothetical protein
MFHYYWFGMHEYWWIFWVFLWILFFSFMIPVRRSNWISYRELQTPPVPALSAVLYERFSSRGEDEFGDKLLSALRYQFGGHKEKADIHKGND